MNHPHSSKSYRAKARPLIPWVVLHTASILTIGAIAITQLPPLNNFSITITVEPNDSTNYGRLPGN